MAYEVLGHLGDGNFSARSLKAASRTLDAIDVVGITERMDETVVLFAERWRLPLDAVRDSYVSLLINPTRRPVNASTRAAIAAHPAVAREAQLYAYAMRRFSRDLAAVPDLDAKVASVRAAAVACSLSKSECSRPPAPEDE